MLQEDKKGVPESLLLPREYLQLAQDQAGITGPTFTDAEERQLDAFLSAWNELKEEQRQLFYGKKLSRKLIYSTDGSSILASEAQTEDQSIQLPQLPCSLLISQDGRMFVIGKKVGSAGNSVVKRIYPVGFKNNYVSFGAPEVVLETLSAQEYALRGFLKKIFVNEYKLAIDKGFVTEHEIIKQIRNSESYYGQNGKEFENKLCIAIQDPKATDALNDLCDKPGEDRGYDFQETLKSILNTYGSLSQEQTVVEVKKKQISTADKIKRVYGYNPVMISTNTKDYLTMPLAITTTMEEGRKKDEEEERKEKKKETPNSPLQDAIAYMIAVCSIHESGMIHGNISPDSLPLLRGLTVNGVSRSVALPIDFGSSDDAQNPQKQQQRRGAPGYMAPEVTADDPSVLQSSDIWSLGIMLVCLLADDGAARDQFIRGVNEAAQANNSFTGAIDFANCISFSKSTGDKKAEDSRKQLFSMLAIDPKKRMNTEQLRAFYQELQKIGLSATPEVPEQKTESSPPALLDTASPAEEPRHEKQLVPEKIDEPQPPAQEPQPLAAAPVKESQPPVQEPQPLAAALAPVKEPQPPVQSPNLWIQSAQEIYGQGSSKEELSATQYLGLTPSTGILNAICWLPIVSSLLNILKLIETTLLVTIRYLQEKGGQSEGMTQVGWAILCMLVMLIYCLVKPLISPLDSIREAYRFGSGFSGGNAVFGRLLALACLLYIAAAYFVLAKFVLIPALAVGIATAVTFVTCVAIAKTVSIVAAALVAAVKCLQLAAFCTHRPSTKPSQIAAPKANAEEKNKLLGDGDTQGTHAPIRSLA